MGVVAQTQLHSSAWFEHYATIAGDKDLLALDPRVAAAKQSGLPCRQIICTGNPGALVVKRLDGTNVTLNMITGMSLELSCKQLIAAGTVATEITVLW